jgi:hypothetical protein
MDRFIINARPQPFDAQPRHIVIYPTMPMKTTQYLTIKGRSFFNIKNIYFKNLKNDVFSRPVTLYNPFSSVSNLSANNSKFYGIKINNFTVINDNMIIIQIPQIFLNKGYFDIVVENEAGFGFLTQDSKVPNTLKFGGFKNTQKYTVDGVYVNII